MFCIAKGRLLHLKRASFTVQKVLFYNPKEPLSETNHEKSCQQQPLPTVWNIQKNIPTPYPHLLIACITLTFLRRLTVVNVSFLFPAGSDINSN